MTALKAAAAARPEGIDAADGLHSRFRRAVQPADRAARPRAGRLFRDRSVRHAVETMPRARAGGAHSFGRPGEHARRGRARDGPAIVESGVPILGICYGMQLIAREIGAELVSWITAEYGPATLLVSNRDTPLFDGVPEESRVWMSHGDTVVEAAARLPGARLHRALPRGRDGRIAKRRIYAVQFHPEVAHTRAGTHGSRELLGRDRRDCAGDWKMESFVERRWRRFASGSAATRSFARFPAGSIRRLRRRWWRARSASS